MGGGAYSVTEESGALQRRRRRLDTVDMMLSMHSLLAQENGRRAVLLDLTILCTSLILVASALIDPAVLPRLHMTPEGMRFTAAACSLLVFALSIVGLRVDWKEQAARHQRAATVLAELKGKWRMVASDVAGADPARSEELERQTDYAMTLIQPVPESDFHRLKARHKYKVALSRALDAHPGAWLPIVRLRLFLRSSMEVVRGDSGAERAALEKGSGPTADS
jgi:hypothetical protein